MGKDSRTNEHVWHREDRLSIKLNLQWPQLPPPPPQPKTKTPLRLFVSQALPLVRLFDGRLPHWGTGWTEMLAYLLPPLPPDSRCCYYLFDFLVLVSGWHVKLFKSKDAPPLSLCASHHGKREMNNREERGEAIPTTVILLKEAVNTHKKSVSTKMYNQTNKQTNQNHLLQVERWTVSWSSLFPFVTFGATMFFYAFCFPFPVL